MSSSTGSLTGRLLCVNASGAPQVQLADCPCSVRIVLKSKCRMGEASTIATPVALQLALLARATE
eukprot:CAMPEP_0175468662 /NCGR_PEP_ID=MMETSP0095-20121207/71943_1 /TAXON_ID=311494 /ORGANISM="Alexandrium monilatum, Strain CCMP3105" /LENGTH=64 /DNA_ID=CAMNT_0016770057 /DNA_START=92 /DNA_END=283 /DNA_ORIENTATION=+